MSAWSAIRHPVPTARIFRGILRELKGLPLKEKTERMEQMQAWSAQQKIDWYEGLSR